MTRPWDTIEKVDRAFTAHNQTEQSAGRARITVKDFQLKCASALKGIVPTELAAINRWAASKMRG
jgi:hypothetical protein